MENKPVAQINELLEDYATSPVPSHIAVKGYRIAIINTSLAFSLPALLVGVQLGAKIGLEQSILSFILGGVIVALIGFVSGLIGVKNRVSTYILLQQPFGFRNSKLVNVVMSCSFFGWFGVNVYLFGQSATALWSLITDVPLERWVFVLVGGVLMTGGALWGFKSIQKLAFLVVPIQIVALIFLVQLLWENATFESLSAINTAESMPLGASISVVVGAFIVAAATMPDFTRYGKTWQDAMVASVFPFLLINMCTYTIAASAALWTGESDILKVMVAAGLGVSAFILVIFSSWITNAMNLYGCSLSLSAAFPRFHEWQIVIITGTIGTIVALLGILEHFIDFVFSLGIVFTPIFSIYAVDFFILNKGKYQLSQTKQQSVIVYMAVIAWLVGIVAAYGAENAENYGLDANWFQLTSIASVDSLLVSGLVYFLLVKLYRLKFLQKN